MCQARHHAAKREGFVVRKPGPRPLFCSWLWAAPLASLSSGVHIRGPLQGVKEIMSVVCLCGCQQTASAKQIGRPAGLWFACGEEMHRSALSFLKLPALLFPPPRGRIQSSQGAKALTVACNQHTAHFCKRKRSPNPFQTHSTRKPLPGESDLTWVSPFLVDTQYLISTILPSTCH